MEGSPTDSAPGKAADIVYVLGAGTSVSAGLPTMNDFLHAAERAQDDISNGAAKTRFQRALAEWKAMPGMNVEEYFTLTELEDRIDSGGRLGERTRAARYLIAKTIHAAWRRKNGPSTLQGDFLARIFERAKHDACKEAVLTLNWDVVFEDAAAPLRHLRLDYGLSDAEEPDPKGKEPDALAVPFRKMHGSLNWLACSECGRLTITRSNIVMDHYEGTPPLCTCGTGALEPLIVPPSSQKFDKAYGAKALAPVWRGARANLESCSFLAIIGYSMPPTDVQFRSFVVDALRRNPHRVRVTVVSPPKFGFQKIEFEDRFARAFGLSNVDLEFVPLRFGERRQFEALYTIPYLGRFAQDYVENLRVPKGYRSPSQRQ